MKSLFVPLLLLLSSHVVVHDPVDLPRIHSHNDYQQKAPFWLAYAAGATSVEIDVILKDNELFVAHSEREIQEENTIENLYFEQLAKLEHDYRPLSRLSFLVDIKTQAGPAMQRLVQITSAYPELFNDSPQSICLVISGNRPSPDTYASFPSFISFDGRAPSDLKEEGAERVAMVSRNFSDFTSWQGEGKLPVADSLKLVDFIQQCHKNNKPVRFWNTADNEKVYRTLLTLEADFINTDHPFAVKSFLDRLDSGKELPPWQEGFLDIHHISTGRGNATFMVFPDGTTMVVDIGDMSETHPRTRSARNTPALPDHSKSPAEWVADYIRQFAPKKQSPVIDYVLITHYHDDHFGEADSLRKFHPKGNYMLTGITELGSLLPVSKLMDRGTDFPVDLKNSMIWAKYGFNNDPYSMITTLQEYWKFIEYQKKNGLVYEPFVSGVQNQVQLNYHPEKYSDFKVSNLFVNGQAKDRNGNLISLYAEGEYPGENDLSAGIKISYGKFGYYTGGDITGIDDQGQEKQDSPETVFAPLIGPVDVATLNHHGNRNSQNPLYVNQLQPRVWILQAWSSDHPGEEVLRRITSRRLYAGPRDIYATSLLEPNHLVIGDRIDNSFQSLHGHVVIRVLPKGETYMVYVLNDRTTQRGVISERSYYSH